ncbi:hypothetical protein ACHAQA_000922 [Verticillium albo-atrum]
MNEEERRRIIADYEADFRGFEQDHEGEDASEEAATKRVHFLRPDLEPGLSPEQKALARKQEFEQQTGDTISDDDWFSIWSHETSNDGMLERLRKWAEGRDSVPVVYFNAFIQKTYAAMYDAVAEEDRLRAQKLAMQLDYDEKLEQDRKDCEERCARARAEARAAAEVETLRRLLDQTLDQAERHQQQFAQGSSDNTQSAAFTEAHASAVKALEDRARVEEAVDETASQHIPPSETLLKGKDVGLRAAVDHLRSYLSDQPSTAETLRSLVDSLLTASDARQKARKNLFDTKERQRQEAESRASNALRVQNLGFQHFIEIERQLHDANSRLDLLQRRSRKREDEVDALQRAVRETNHKDLTIALASVNAYRDLVCERVRDGLQRQSNAVLVESNKLEESILAFENVGHILKNMSPPLPADVAPSLLAELARIAALFESAPGTLRSMASDLLDESLTEEKELTTRMEQADRAAAIHFLEEELQDLKEEKERLEARLLTVHDTAAIEEALAAQTADRQRADECQARATDLASQLKETYAEKATAAKNAERRLDAMQRSIDRAHAPRKALERRVAQAEEKFRTAQLRAEVAEDKVKDLLATLEELSDDFMTTLGNAPRDPAAVLEKRTCAGEDHEGLIAQLTTDMEVLQGEKKAQEESTTVDARRELDAAVAVSELALERVRAELSEYKETFEVRLAAEIETSTAEIVAELEQARPMDRDDETPRDESMVQVELRICQRQLQDQVAGKVAVERSLESFKRFNTKLLVSNCELRKLLSDHDRAYATLQLSREADPVSGEDFRKRLAELQEEVVGILRRRDGDLGSPTAEETWGAGKRQSVVRIQQAFSGTPSTANTEAGQMSNAQIEAYWRYLSFQRQRAQAVVAMRHGDWEAALLRLEDVDRWFEKVGEWHRFYWESEIQGSVLYVRAYCLAKMAGAMLGGGVADWRELLESAKLALDRAAEIAEGEDHGDVDEADDIVVETEKQFAQAWESLGTRARQEMDVIDAREEARGDPFLPHDEYALFV